MRLCCTTHPHRCTKKHACFINNAKLCFPLHRYGPPTLERLGFVRLRLQYVAQLAVESLADGIEGGEIGNMIAPHLCK